jgi:mono/diheme cytochrome c family protein
MLYALAALAALAALFLLIQAVPYGRDHSNPTVTKEPAWDSPQTRPFAKAACFDCHSNETTWPWYSNVAPMSWLVENDVKGGRTTLNFSEWDRPQGADDIVDAVQGGEMPPWCYAGMPNHSGARLSSTEKNAFVRGSTRRFGRPAASRWLRRRTSRRLRSAAASASS